jgi:hypothetical protein
MRTTKLLSLSILAACITTGVAIADDEVPAVPATPAAVTELVSAQPFTLQTPAKHLWRAENVTYSSGYLLVLKVDPALVFPRQTAEPVLFVGHQTAERVNFGHESGHVIAIVPGVIDDPKHPDYIDLGKTLIWFGTPQLPEQVDADVIKQELALAKRAGIKPLLTPRQSQKVKVSDKAELYGSAAALIQRYSPQEQELVRTLTGTAE